jgi:hypothetical protein
VSALNQNSGLEKVSCPVSLVITLQLKIIFSDPSDSGNERVLLVVVVVVVEAPFPSIRFRSRSKFGRRVSLSIYPVGWKLWEPTGTRSQVTHKAGWSIDHK